MSFAVVAGAVAAPLVGGLLGSDSGSQSTTSTAKMDPRMDRYIYGPDGETGLLGAAFNLAQNQLASGGLNDMQRQGMEMQRQYLLSPQYQQGFGNMAQLGQSLMGGGVAGNPFTTGGVSMGAADPFAFSGLLNAALPDYSQQMEMKPAPVTAPVKKEQEYNYWDGGSSA